MHGNTLTDLFIKEGLIPAFPKRCILDGDDEPVYRTDEEEIPKNEEKSQA